MALGAASMAVLMLYRRGRFGLTPVRALLFALILLVCGLTGTKLLYLAENWRETLEHGVSLGGQSFFGAVLLVPLLMPLAGRAFRLSPHSTLDACAPCVSAILAFTRFGCFLNGCCGGIAASLGSLSFRWPTQLMESLWDMCIVLFLLDREERGISSGSLYPLFLLLYCPARFLLEFLRDTPKDWLRLSHGQWFAAVSAVVGGLALYSLRRGARTE